ncbi:hypothetical protein [Erythrobacter sp. BLCC-B19]|uniref:hypothetical protein n=1 Tax=Erythrobacter sp. BLCC-B19 TaxID=3025315 RepID=UPI00235E621C|nr:hypothetical protein [Erythrobacter sp. BLCC-B19]WDA42725.1 hypothetical protein PS060_07930 [Erythrobacter sp. BLCC-B19]
MRQINPIYIVSGCLFLVALTIFGSAPHSPSLSNWLQKWQALIGSVLALIGAYWTVSKISQQIEHSEKVESRRVRRAYEGRLATLPLVLSSATSYADDVVRALSEARRIMKGSGSRRLTGQWSPPVFPGDLPSELRSFIEVSDHEGANRLVAELLRQIQTLDSRLSSLVSEEDVYRIGILRNIAEYQLQASKVKQLCGALFPFARDETAELPKVLPRLRVVEALLFIDDDAEEDPDFQKMRDIFLSVQRPWWPPVRD